MTDQDSSRRDKLGLAAFSCIFWLLVPLPFWLLASGFAGTLVVPDFGLLGRGDAGISLVFSALFYSPLALSTFALWKVVRSPRGSS